MKSGDAGRPAPARRSEGRPEPDAAASGLRITAAVWVEEAGEAATKALESLLAQSLPADHYEILVVGDAATARSAGSTEPPPAAANLRRIEGALGDATEARNLALQNARAPLFALLDAHAIADRHWLASLCRTFAQFGEIARTVGGRVRPLWEIERPVWLGDDLLAELSVVDLGEEARFLAAGERLAPVNIAFRKAAVEALGGFRHADDHPPAGAAAIAVGSGPDLIDRIEAPPARSVYDPWAVVDYPVPAERLCQEWFRRRAAWRAVAELARVPRPTPAVVAERWQAVKDFFFACPPTERTVRGLVLHQDDPRRFRRQVAAIYDSVFCLLSGTGEPDYD
jgi:hypothetical protein